MKLKDLFCLMLLSLLAVTSKIQAASKYESHDNIKKVAIDYVQQNIPMDINGVLKVKVGHLDERLRLHRCHEPLSAYLPAGREILSTNSLGVRCDDEHKPWSMYIPIKVAIQTKVIVASTPIAANERISEHNTELVDFDVHKLKRGYFQVADDVFGKIAKRYIRLGAPLTPQVLAQPSIVKRGQHITIMAKSGNLKVSSKGYALMDGGMGERIRVQNKHSKRVVEGVITGPGHVRVQL